jgi:group I intron endonuclease
MKSGIYVIVINNKRCIGSAVNLQTRLHTHKSNLRLNKHPNKHLQAAYNKYLDFDCYVIECCEKANLLARERIWIRYFKSHDREFGYNKRIEPNSNLGIKKPHSEETKLKIGLAHKGRKLSPEHIEKSRLARKGYVTSEETKIKLALAGTGRIFSQETKDKIGKANSTGEWLCPDKSLCKCRRCLDLKNLKRRTRTAKNRRSSKFELNGNMVASYG